MLKGSALQNITTTMTAEVKDSVERPEQTQMNNNLSDQNTRQAVILPTCLGVPHRPQTGNDLEGTGDQAQTFLYSSIPSLFTTVTHNT